MSEALEHRFFVLKMADLHEALDSTQKQKLQLYATLVEEWRLDHGKKLNTYVVINTDEPYFPMVLHLMELYGQLWSTDERSPHTKGHTRRL